MNRRGFTLIEVMIAVTMLAIIVGTLTRASGGLAVKGRAIDLVAKRNAALQAEANKLGAQKFTALAVWSTSNKTVTRGDFTYTRRLTITAPSTTQYTIKIVIVPSADTTKKDSVSFDRVSASTSTVLCSGC